MCPIDLVQLSHKLILSKVICYHYKNGACTLYNQYIVAHIAQYDSCCKLCPRTQEHKLSAS